MAKRKRKQTMADLEPGDVVRLRLLGKDEDWLACVTYRMHEAWLMREMSPELVEVSEPMAIADRHLELLEVVRGAA